jgi:hypothetical protein
MQQRRAEAGMQNGLLFHGGKDMVAGLWR